MFDQLSIDGDSQVCKVLAGPTNGKALTLTNGKAGSLIVPLLFLCHATLRGEDKIFNQDSKKNIQRFAKRKASSQC